VAQFCNIDESSLKLPFKPIKMLSTSNSTHYFSDSIYSGKVCYCHAAMPEQIQCLFTHNFWNLVTNSMKQLKY